MHRLVKSTADEDAGQLLAQRLGRGWAVGQAHLHPARQRDVVVPVDAEHFLHHVRRPRHISAVGGGAEVHSLFVLPVEGEVEIAQDALHAVAVEGHANERVQGGPVQPDGGRAGQAIGFEGLHTAFDLGACVFVEQVHGELKGGAKGLPGRLPAQTERGVRAQGVPLGAFADGHGLEPGTLEEHPAGAFAHTGFLSAVDAGEAHRAVLVGDDEVRRRQGKFPSVEGGEGFSFRRLPHPDGVASDAVGIERMERLPEVVEHVVRNVDHVVPGLDSDGPQPALHPLRGRSNRHFRQGHAEIAGRTCRVLHLQGDGAFTAGQFRRGHRLQGGQLRSSLFAAVPAPRRAEVEGDAAVAHGVRSVRRQSDFDAVVRFESEGFGGAHSDRRLGRQDEDAVVTLSDAELILGTDHALGDFAADFALLDLERLAFHRVAGGADRGDDDLLAGRDVGSTADDVERGVSADVDRCDTEPVGIGVLATGEDFANGHALEPTGNDGHFLQSLDLEAAGGQDVAEVRGRLLWGCVKREPGGEPIEGDLHDEGA